MRNGHNAARRINHARILLMSDQGHPLGRYTDQQIARHLGVHEKTVARTRKLFVHGGQGPALERKRRLTPPTPPRLDGRAEATLVALCCSPAPAGRVHWTMQLLADELVRRKVVVTVGRETVRKTLKKTSFGRGV